MAVELNKLKDTIESVVYVLMGYIDDSREFKKNRRGISRDQILFLDYLAQVIRNKTVAALIAAQGSETEAEAYRALTKLVIDLDRFYITFRNVMSNREAAPVSRFNMLASKSDDEWMNTSDKYGIEYKNLSRSFSEVETALATIELLWFEL